MRNGVIAAILACLLVGVNAARAQQCAQNDACTSYACQDGSCVGTATVTCTQPADLCKVATCNPTTGQCDITDRDCDDGNPCTADSCNSATGCVHTSLTGSCDTGNPCTTGTCVQIGLAPAQCVPSPVPNGTTCATEDACYSFACQTGFCLPTVKVQCPQSDHCSFAFCNPTSGSCDSVPVTCSDTTCATGSCDPATGCVYAPRNEGQSCNDGNTCTGPDTCQSGECIGAALTSGTSTPTAVPTETPTVVPSDTPTAVSSDTPTVTPTQTPSSTSVPSETATAVPSNSATLTPTTTATTTPTATATTTPTTTPSFTATVPASATAANTATDTPTLTPTATPTLTPTASATVSPTVALPQLSVQPPAPHSFGIVRVGSSGHTTYTVQNVGGGVLTGTATTPCAGFDVAPPDFSLAAGEQVTLTVTFTPTSEGPASCQLLVNSNAGSVQIALSASALPAAPVPSVSDPRSPAGMAMIALFAAGMAWLLRAHRSQS